MAKRFFMNFLKLLILFAVIASLIFGVNLFTRGKMKTEAAERKETAMLNFFGSDGIVYEQTSYAATTAHGCDVYLVKDDNYIIGFCASVEKKGFVGTVDMMVAFDAAGAVIGVEVLSVYEQNGADYRIFEEEFLSQFVGKTQPLTVGKDIGLISGAFSNSLAVIQGVNLAIEAVGTIVSGGSSV